MKSTNRTLARILLLGRGSVEGAKNRKVVKNRRGSGGERCRARWVAIGVLTASLALAGASSQAGPLATARMPELLQAPQHQKVLLRLYAKGWQIYQSMTNSDDVRQSHLTLKGSEAMLFDELGNAVGWHHVGAAGPVWELDKEGSKVCGVVLRSVDSPAAGAMPWSLVRATSHGGSGPLSQATYIQVIKTQGGKASTSRAEIVRTGDELRVSYTAEVVFYRERR